MANHRPRIGRRTAVETRRAAPHERLTSSRRRTFQRDAGQGSKLALRSPLKFDGEKAVAKLRVRELRTTTPLIDATRGFVAERRHLQQPVASTGVHEEALNQILPALHPEPRRQRRRTRRWPSRVTRREACARSIRGVS